MNLEFIRKELSEGKFIEKDLSEDMMKMSKEGNIEYFRDIIDKITEDEWYNIMFTFDPETHLFKTIRNKNSLYEIILNLMIFAIDNFDEDMLNYILKENKIFLKYKYDLLIYSKDIIIYCLDKKMFDFASLIIQALKNDIYNINFRDYIEDFEKVLIQEDTITMNFFFDNFEIDTIFIYKFIIYSLTHMKKYSIKILIKEYRKRYDVGDSKDKLIKFLYEEMTDLNDKSKEIIAVTIDGLWEQIINVAENV